MTPRQLQIFVELARAGSIGAAADRLFVTQPAVSLQLAALEHELGVQLVTRERHRGIRLTLAGEVLAGYARRMLGLFDEARLATRSAAAPETGRVRLAAVTTAGEQILPGLIAGFRRLYPKAELSLEVGNRGRVFGLLEHNEVDLVIGGRPLSMAGLMIRAVRGYDLVLVGPSRLVARTATIDDVANVTWLLREPGSGTRAATEEYLMTNQLAPATLTLGSNGAIREALTVGLGITLISRDAVARDLRSGRLVALGVPGIPQRRHWQLIVHDGQQLPATAELFVRHLVAHGSFVAAGPPGGTPPDAGDRGRQATSTAGPAQVPPTHS